jgi:transcriptional regulator with XRE-family HTH domain
MIAKTPPMAKPENVALGKRLGASRREAGLDVAQASELTGIPVATIKAHEKGARRPPLEVQSKYARAYGVDPLWLLGMSKRSPVQKLEVPEGMPVVGTLAAGLYQTREPVRRGLGNLAYESREAIGGRPTHEYDDHIPVQYDPTYNESVQYACRISGSGMNVEYPDGSYVVCASLQSTDARLGDHVICARYYGEDLAEYTVRELERDPRTGLLRMASLSTDPRYQGSVVVKEGEAQVIAVVISSYRRRARRGQAAISATLPLHDQPE